MKNLLFILLFIFVSTSSVEAQRRTQTIKWFSIAAKAGIGNSVFLNSDIINDANVEFDYLSLSQSYGGRMTFTYGENVGLGVEVLSSSYGQKYTVDANIKKLKLKTLDILPFFRYTGSTGGYIELGAKISNVKSITETNTNPLVFVRNDLATYYEPKFTSLVLGFGLALYKGERIDVNLGARFAYSFKDITPDNNFNIINDNLYIPTYSKTATTNLLSAQAIFEVNYYFAFWGDATCGRGRLMLFQ
jgi:hypothetical protein